MGWSIGYDPKWKRDIGYGVPAYCDHPECNEVIHRGLSHVCGGKPYGGETGCGLYFCEDHMSRGIQLCDRCWMDKPPFKAKPDHPEWIKHKLTDETWKQWRDENPETVKELKST